MFVPTAAPQHSGSKASVVRRHTPLSVVVADPGVNRATGGASSVRPAVAPQSAQSGGAVVSTASTNGVQSTMPTASLHQDTVPVAGKTAPLASSTQSVPTTSYTQPTASQMAPLSVDSGWLRSAAAAAGIGGTTARVMRPWFHVTSGDATVVSLEHHAHSGLTAFALSSGEVFVTRPELAVNATTPPPWLSFVGKLPGAVSHICWAPWQYGSIFACCCPGKCAKVFSCQSSGAGSSRDDASPWTEELVDVQDCLAVAFCSLSTQPSAPLRLICACARGIIAVCQRGDESFGAWTDASYHQVAEISSSLSGSGGDVGGKPSASLSASVNQTATTVSRRSGNPSISIATARDLLSVSVAEGGSLLACGDAEGFVRLCELQADGKKGLVVRVVAVIAPAGLSSTSTSPPKGPSVNSSAPLSPMHGQQTLAIRHLAWGPSNGRSFIPLAYGSNTELNVILFATATHFLALLETTAMTSSAPTSVDAIQSHHQTYKRLGGRSMVIAPDRELLKLTWNPIGTRLSTSHIDGVTRIFALSVAHRDVAAMPPAAPPASMSSDVTLWVKAPTNTPITTDAFYVDFLEVARAVAPSSNLDAQYSNSHPAGVPTTRDQ